MDARAIAGPRTYEAEKLNHEILTTPVLIHGRNHGYYAGATVKTRPSPLVDYVAEITR